MSDVYGDCVGGSLRLKGASGGGIKKRWVSLCWALIRNNNRLVFQGGLRLGTLGEQALPCTIIIVM